MKFSPALLRKIVPADFVPHRSSSTSTLRLCRRECSMLVPSSRSIWTAASSLFFSNAICRSATALSSSNMSTSSTITTNSAVAVPAASTLASIQNALDNSWVRQLWPETNENLQRSRRLEGLDDDDNNRRKRPVKNGHYVLVPPTPLPTPTLILYSPDVARLLHLTDAQIQSTEFVEWVSGNRVLGETWATPYALSIMGSRYYNNCPYGTGEGYGDGRAIAIGELHGYELQLKGAGPTPFCRGADGRAVLRSSIREFLASEAMQALHVRTTRALSLVVSGTERVSRPWYAEGSSLQLPADNDPRLSNYSADERRALLQQLRNHKADPNMMISEQTAITCRVAPSFVRIGHLDLFARRAEKASQQNGKETTQPRYDTSTNEWKELEAMVWHACYRDFRTEAYDPFYDDGDIGRAAAKLLELSAERLAAMVANWIRVGFTQGNFNADNCLVGGHTMDYGPFGWVEEYNPLAAKWTGSGDHFGFMNQPNAALANYGILCQSVGLVIAARKEQNLDTIVDEFMSSAQQVFQRKLDEVWRQKLGFSADHDVADELYQPLETLLRQSRTDWTFFWRRLAYLARDQPDLLTAKGADLLQALEKDDDNGQSPFYQDLREDLRPPWMEWLESWRTALQRADVNTASAWATMNKANPKYVLREWMLAVAYEKANQGNYDELKRLFAVIQRPYDEGSPDEAAKYFRRASEEQLTTGGVAFFS